jgi:hypothetical protein
MKSQEIKDETNIETNVETKVGNNVETNVGNNVEPNIETNIETKDGNNVETKVETKVESVLVFDNSSNILPTACEHFRRTFRIMLSIYLPTSLLAQVHTLPVTCFLNGEI